MALMDMFKPAPAAPAAPAPAPAPTNTSSESTGGGAQDPLLTLISLLYRLAVVESLLILLTHSQKCLILMQILKTPPPYLR